MRPAQISFWGNDVHGDCVTAEEAFAKACHNPEIFVPDGEVISWATQHGVLEGAGLQPVMTWMQQAGFATGTNIYNDGSCFAVNWQSTAAMQSAIFEGPVKLAIAADQLDAAWLSTNGKSGWFGTGWNSDTNYDHCVSLCGYGPMSWLAGQFAVQVPAGVDGAKPGYAMFTWNSIGIVDAPSMINVTAEAWIRQPTTVSGQPNWRWCNKCQVLAFAGNPSLGACAAGGQHNHTGSGDYALAQNVPAGAHQQSNWRWCNKCQVLAFAGNPSLGACAAGGEHSHAGSGNYVLTQNVTVQGAQSGWMWCNKCRVLAFAGNPSLGACAAGGVHSHAGSGNYEVPFA
ncbi:MAG: hypothetical protein JF598_03890 [Streptomyces sp.]|nr:hypothetical protein [Streptomyces sp.]